MGAGRAESCRIVLPHTEQVAESWRTAGEEGISTMNQELITRARIEEMVTWRPPRFRLMEWDALRPPSRPGQDWHLRFPFHETFANLCESSCPAPHGGVMRDRYDERRAFAYLKCDDHELVAVERWLAELGPFVALRDLLALSFALDYERVDGSPENPQTEIGALRARAKTYGRAPTGDTREAATELAERCMAFLEIASAYRDADAVVAMPPSDPDKPFDLPRHLAQHIARRWSRDDLSPAVRPPARRPQVKNLRLAEKLDRLEGTVHVDSAVQKRKFLLVDDLYQSGSSMNYVAMLLQQAGADCIYGLALEKTCRNDDNAGDDA